MFYPTTKEMLYLSREKIPLAYFNSPHPGRSEEHLLKWRSIRSKNFVSRFFIDELIIKNDTPLKIA